MAENNPLYLYDNNKLLTTYRRSTLGRRPLTWDTSLEEPENCA